VNQNIYIKNFSEKNMNLLGFSNKFEDASVKERVMDSHVLSEETIRIERVKEQLVSIFLDYIQYLVKPISLENMKIPALVDNFFLHCHKTKINAESMGYKYEFANPSEDTELSIDFKEIMHVKGVQIVRELNLPPEDVIIINNDYDRGLMEYSFNKIRTPR
jgi:hypothetical protein